jgi:hypothetical protein
MSTADPFALSDDADDANADDDAVVDEVVVPNDAVVDEVVVPNDAVVDAVAAVSDADAVTNADADANAVVNADAAAPVANAVVAPDANVEAADADANVEAADADANVEAVPEVANAVPEVANAAPAVAPEVVPDADAGSPMAQLEQLTKDISFMNVFESKQKVNEVRKEVEAGLQAFNGIQDACKIIDDAIRSVDAIQSGLSDNSLKLHSNPSIGLLADFVPHCKLLVSANGIATEPIVAAVKTVFGTLIADARFQSPSYKNITVEEALIGNIGTQISLVLRIGEVFNVPVFTAYVIRDVFNNKVFDSDEVVAPTIAHNSKTIANCGRLDFMLELLLHAVTPTPYDEVNVLVAHITDTLFVSKFSNSNPNAVIATECAKLFELILPEANATANPMITKTVLIAIIQNPAIKTDDGKQFADIFPSGQYIKYFGEVAYRATPIARDQGPIMIDNEQRGLSGAPRSSAPEGDAPGSKEEEEEADRRMHMSGTPHPLTRTEIIVAALTAVNTAMGPRSNIVAAGGAAVSYYIKDFVKGMNAGEFASIIADSGLKTDDLEALKQGCDNIRMNDIDCFVFGEVSRQFLLMFSLYMMILYANFYERPQQLWRYGAMSQDTSIQFDLSPAASSDHVQLFMYGNRKNDANTKLIGKQLKKNKNVKLVTKEVRCFSQLVNAICGASSDKCNVDGYYMQPIDLVIKQLDDFVVLYESLYPQGEGHDMPDLKALLESQYSKGVDNMVSMKTTMLDLICIFCNEDKALFIRVFMARKNPKDFARLRVFIEIYLLQLLRKKDDAFETVKSELISEIVNLRDMMRMLNERYYSEQGNIAAVQAETAPQLNADRIMFLQLLRRIGRKIVLIPDPLDNAIPATFRKETGMNTVRFFRSIPNTQIKYPFDMMDHMNQFCTIFYAQIQDKPLLQGAYSDWLNVVISQFRFNEESKPFFREKLKIILDNGEGNLEIDFKDMPVRSPLMLRLLNELRGIDFNDEVFRKYKLIMRDLLTPLKNAQTMSNPNANYVGVRTKPNGMYPLATKSLFPAFAKALLMGNKKMNELPPHIKELVEELEVLERESKKRPEVMFDDAVNEEIGRILLDYAANVTEKQLQTRGGSTRKCKRKHGLNAKTRSKPGLINGKKRGTRKKCKASNPMCKRTHKQGL